MSAINQSPMWVHIVQFVRDSLDWPVDAQSSATGISSTSLYDWCRGRCVPGVTTWARYMRWVLSLSCVRNYSDGGPWAQPHERFSHRHQVYLLHGFERWMVLYFYDGDLVDIDHAKFRREQGLDELLEELAEMTAIKMDEIEQESGVKCA